MSSWRNTFNTLQTIAGFLHSQQQIFKAVKTVYNLFLAPILNPVLAFYFTLWKFIARQFGYVISFLHVIAQSFDKESPKDRQRSTKDDSASDDISLKTEWDASQYNHASLLSFLDHDSRKERATSGPRKEGSGGGLLKATIGSVTFSSAIVFPLSVSSFPSFFGSKEGTIPPHDPWMG